MLSGVILLELTEVSMPYEECSKYNSVKLDGRSNNKTGNVRLT